MRWSPVLLTLLLAGCAGTGPEGPDASSPIHVGGVLHHFGPEATDPDAHVIAIDCAEGQQVSAFTIDAAEAVGADATSLHLYQAFESWIHGGDIRRFVIIAFDAEDDALVPVLAVGGDEGVETASYRLARTGSLASSMPDRLEIPVGDDGLARLVVGCDGAATVNYVVSREPGDGSAPQRPHYLPATHGSGYATFLGHAMDEAWGRIPPAPAGLPPTVSIEIGPVEVTIDHVAVPGAVRGTTAVQWTAGPGWTHVYCGHDGDTEHATWRYTGDLHGAKRDASGTIVNNAAMLFAPRDVLGTTMLYHMGGGDAPATMRYEVEHEASLGLFWDTGCDGFHIGTTLDDLFGLPAHSSWSHVDGLVP